MGARKPDGSDCGRATKIGTFVFVPVRGSRGQETEPVRRSPGTASTSWLIPTRLCARFSSR